MLLLRSAAVDRAGSSVQWPASEPSVSRARSAAWVCWVGVVMTGSSAQ
jgi:hypothetical protein